MITMDSAVGLAKLLLKQESSGPSDPPVNAAVSVRDKLVAELSPLLGDAGVRALLGRTQRIVQLDLPNLKGTHLFESGSALRAGLEPLAPAAAAETAALVFGTFLSLLSNFIGERLTFQALRHVWPNVQKQFPRESDK